MAIAIIALNGCINVDGDTINNSDNSVDNTGQVLLTCTDSNCTALPAGSDRADADAVVGKFDADYGPAACRAAGYSYCDRDKVCINTPTGTSGACNR